MKLQNQFDDKQWQDELKYANRVFNQGKKASSVRYYQAAIDIAMQLFSEFKKSQTLPDALTPVLVVSYLNLADCWGAQNKKTKQILCLIEIYDLLKVVLNDYSISQALSRQVYDGVNKVFIELCLCFKAIDAQQELLKTQEDFAELTLLYQSQLCTVH